MEVYEWRENAVWLAARVRPKELFDQSTVEPLSELTWDEEFPHCDGMGTEGRGEALNLVTGRLETYERVFDKRYWTREQAEDVVKRDWRQYHKRDALDLAKLPAKVWQAIEKQES